MACASAAVVGLTLAVAVRRTTRIASLFGAGRYFGTSDVGG
jgi:hypothetical protein